MYSIQRGLRSPSNICIFPISYPLHAVCDLNFMSGFIASRTLDLHTSNRKIRLSVMLVTLFIPPKPIFLLTVTALPYVATVMVSHMPCGLLMRPGSQEVVYDVSVFSFVLSCSIYMEKFVYHCAA